MPNVSNATHTPGPWAGPFSRKSYAGHALVAIEGDPGQHISYAIYPQPKSEAESQANARLIAAAPELLGALRTILKRIEDGDLVRDISRDGEANWSMRMMYFVKELQEAQTAIAKAEGR